MSIATEPVAFHFQPETLHPEEGQGGPDAALRYQAQKEYEGQLEFAGIQLRARVLAPEAWTAYMQRADIVNVLDKLYDEGFNTFNPEGRDLLMTELRAQSAQRRHWFELWRDLNALAWADNFAAVTAAQVAAGINAVHWMEQKKADDLLTAQAASARNKAEREAAEKAEADNPFRDE
jgi:hypothetical protein